jgi:hypothetical protein
MPSISLASLHISKGLAKALGFLTLAKWALSCTIRRTAWGIGSMGSNNIALSHFA